MTAPVEHGHLSTTRQWGVTVLRCRCGQKFVGSREQPTRALLDAHAAELNEKAARASGSVRVILAHTTGPSGLRETVAVGPLMSTEDVAKQRFQLEQAGAECEVVSLQSLAQFLRATQPAEPPTLADSFAAIFAAGGLGLDRDCPPEGGESR